MAQRRRRNQGGPWGDSKPAVIGTLTVACLAGVLYGMPLGLAADMICAAVFSSWPGPEHYENPDQQKRAILLKAIGSALRAPDMGMLGFGEPGEAEGVARTSRPPNRISSWWSLIAAISTAFIPYVRFGAVTAICIYILAQAIAKGVRMTRDPSGPAPAPLLHKEAAANILKRDASKIGFIATATGAFGSAGILAIPAGIISPPAKIVGIVAATVLPAFAYFSHMYRVEALSDWYYQIATRSEWESRWMSIPRLGVAPPTWVATLPVPADNPTHEKVVFAVPPGSSIDRYEPFTANLATALSVETVTITPMPQFDENNRPIPGTAQQQGFIVTRTLQPMGPRPHLDPSLDKATRSFAITWAFGEAFKALKLSRPDLVSFAALTTAESPHILIETQWRLGPGNSIDDLTSRAGALQEKLDCRWLRIGRRSIASGNDRVLPANNVSIVFGEQPANVTLRPPARNVKFLIDQLDWSAWFRACKLGEPIMVAPSTVTRRDITESVFQAAEGMSIDTVKKTIPALKATTGYGYIAVEPEDRSDRFRVLTGARDPLDAPYLFVDYRDGILRTPEKAKPQIDWIVGVGSDGELLVSKWESDIAHLLIAGASGMGKSALISSMILQMCHNTDPADLQLRLMEPKNELQRFAGLQHVTHFVDMQTPGESQYHNAAELLGDTVSEMERRYKEFDKHPAKPKKLSDARLIALNEGPLSNGKPHPFDIPYIVVIIEECADFFRAPSLKKMHGEAHDQVIFNVELLARKARASGIYLVIATQYPTNTNLPQTLKQQCRRIGLGVSNQLASQVIIDEGGLEEITVPGRGLVTYGKGYRGFRSLYLRAPNEAQPDLPDDLSQLMMEVPQRDGSGRIFFGAGGAASTNDPAPIPAGIWDD